MPPPKRRLPVLNEVANSEEPSRPFWHWVAFGGAAIFVAWLPLSALAGALASALGRSASDKLSLIRAATVALVSYGATILLGALAGGYVVGRWGPPDFAVRAAAGGGLVATTIAALLSWAFYGISPAPWFAGALAVPMAALGGRLGVLRAKGRSAFPPL